MQGGDKAEEEPMPKKSRKDEYYEAQIIKLKEELKKKKENQKS